MAFARHNIEKHHLIEMVRMNPILWDCRLPHYKRSDKKKDIKWCELGRAFNVSGERVQRTFTSLREIFRRELNHEKLLGDRFTSKWEYYGAMSFLKDVIRERKTRERYREDVNGLFKGIIQEYTNGTDHLERTNVNMQPDVVINDSTLNPDNSSSEASTPSLSIKEEPTDNDGDDEYNEDSSKLNQKNHHRLKNISQAIPHQSYHNNESLEPTASTSSCNQRPNAKKNQHHNGLPGPTDQTSSINNQRQSARRVKNATNNNYNQVFSDSESEEEEKPTKVKEQSAREILYTKFGEFLSARLNTLNETAADDLMNRTLLLIAENRY